MRTLSPQTRRTLRWLGVACGLALAVVGFVLWQKSLPAPAKPAAPPSASAPASGAAATASTAQGSLALEGRVEDDYGRSVEGATVEALRVSGSAMQSAATGATDAKGSFRLGGLAAGRYEVRARKPGYSDQAIGEVAVPAESILQLKLERTGVLRGRVVHGDGKPAAGAQVVLRGSGAAAPPNARSEPDGTFELNGLPAGIYGVDAKLSTGLAELVSEPEEGIELQPGAEAWVMLELSASAVLSGQITDRATGRPIPAATIAPEPDGLARPVGPIATDLEGRFAIAGLRGGVARVLAQAPGYVPQSELGIAGGAPIAIALQLGGALSGKVVDEAGAPVAGADLEVIQQGAELVDSQTPSITLATGESLGVTVGAVPKIPIEGGALPLGFFGSGGVSAGGGVTLRSAADGSFRITPVAPGNLLVVARHPAFTAGQSAVVELKAGAECAGLQIALGLGGTVQGEVLDAEELPAPGIPIELSLQQGDASLKLTTVSDRDGRFELGPVRGTGVVIAHPPGEPPVQVDVVVETPEDVPVVLRLSGESGRILGEIAGASGEPLVAAVVRVSVPNATPPFTRTAVTDSDGRFELAGLPKALCQLEIEHSDHVPLALEVVPGSEPLRLQLASGARLRAEVIDSESGDAIPGALVSVRAGPSARSRVLGRGRTTRLGVVEIRSLSDRNYWIYIEHSGHATGRFEALIEAGGEPTDLGTLELTAAASASGQVVDRYGGTVANAQVAAGDPPAWKTAVRTAKDGSFRIRGLPAGDLVLTARAATGELSDPTGARALAGEEAAAIVLRLPTDGSEPEPVSPVSAERDAEPREPAEPRVKADRPEPAAGPSLIEGVPVALGYATGQVRIQRLLSSGARAVGLREGDVLYAVNGERVLAVAQARALLRGPSGGSAVLELMREGKRVSVKVTRERFAP